MSIPRSLALPTGVERSTVETSRGPFAALDATTGGTRSRTPVLLVPGYTGSKEDFLAILAPLAEAGHRAVAIDLRGQHETPGPTDPAAYELDELAADVLAVVAAIGGRAHVVGHSFGGYVTRLAAVRPTARAEVTLASLTLLDSGPSAVTGDGTRMSLAMLAGALPVHDMETIWAGKRALELQRGDPPLPPDIEDFLHARFVGTHPVGLAVAAGQLTAAEDRAAALAEVETPVLVMYGENEDVWAPADLAAMADRIGAEHYVVAGAGHSPAVDDPVTTAAALVDFWRRVEG